MTSYPETLPEVDNIAWVRVGKGFIVVHQVTQGDVVLTRTVLTPDAKPESAEKASARAAAEIGARLVKAGGRS